MIVTRFYCRNLARPRCRQGCQSEAIFLIYQPEKLAWKSRDAIMKLERMDYRLLLASPKYSLIRCGLCGRVHAALPKHRVVVHHIMPDLKGQVAGVTIMEMVKEICRGYDYRSITDEDNVGTLFEIPQHQNLDTSASPILLGRHLQNLSQTAAKYR